MKYFTPQLYVQFNSRDEQIASRADDEWDRREAEYISRLKSFEASLPDSVRFVASRFSLHDAAFIDLVESPQSVQVRVKKYDTLFVLDYHPTAAVEVSTPFPSEVFRPYAPRWLYDEIDVLRPGIYTHQILLSDGRVVHVQFDSLQFYELHPTGTAVKLLMAEEMLTVAKRISRTKVDAGKGVQVNIPQSEVQAIKQAVKTIKANSQPTPSTSNVSRTKVGRANALKSSRTDSKRKAPISRKSCSAASPRRKKSHT